MCIAHLLFDVRDELLLKVLKVVVSLCAANRVKKAAYHGGSVGRTFNLGVELEAIELFSGIFYCRILAGDGVSNGSESRRELCHLIGMAHQPALCGVEPGKQRGIGAYLHLCPAVFAGGAGRDLAAERPGEQLHTVAYAEHRYTYIEYGLVAVGGFLLVYAVGTAGKYDAYGVYLPYLIQGNISRLYYGVNAAFSYSSGDEFFVLSAEIKYQYRLCCHLLSPLNNITQYNNITAYAPLCPEPPR